MFVNSRPFRTVWMHGQTVHAINQQLLPHEFRIATLRNHQETAAAIKTMLVRGAPAIGAAAAFGLAQAALEAPEKTFDRYVQSAAEAIRSTRPTARNLFYAVEQVMEAVNAAGSPTRARERAVAAAQSLADADVEACKRIGQLGSALLKTNMRLATHCNAGWLACVDWGTALSPVYTAKRQGKQVFVFVDETRPRNQGAGLTAWELGQERIPHVIIADNATGHFMQRGEIDLMIVGADRIAANGDTANKIGTYEKAVLAKENGIPFYVAAPASTIDHSCETGRRIPLEERSPDEVLHIAGFDEQTNEQKLLRLAPTHSTARNPAFDVTPARYITGIITERGIVKPGRVRGMKHATGCDRALYPAVISQPRPPMSPLPSPCPAAAGRSSRPARLSAGPHG